MIPELHRIALSTLSALLKYVCLSERAKLCGALQSLPDKYFSQLSKLESE